MAHAIWKGTISFGLVSVPVKLYAATGSKAVRFSYVHRACGTPVQYVKRCPTCNQDLTAEEIAKGYAYPDGRYVLVEEEEIEALPGAQPRTLELSYFVPAAELDPLHFNKSYFLEPGEGGGRAYALLVQVMAEQQVVGLCRFALRAKESLAAIRPGNPLLVLHTLYFPDEVRTTQGLTAPPVGTVRPEEMLMARQLIQGLTGPYNPEELAPRQREALLEHIAAKAATADTLTPAAQPKAEVVDLLAALRASVDRARSTGVAAAATAPPATTKPVHEPFVAPPPHQPPPPVLPPH